MRMSEEDKIREMQLIHDIATEHQFIIKQTEKYDRINRLETGVRSGTVSADLAMIQISITNANDRIKNRQTEIKKLRKYQSNVNKGTRAGPDGKMIMCPCGAEHRVYNFAWSATMCPGCKKMVEKQEFFVTPPLARPCMRLTQRNLDIWQMYNSGERQKDIAAVHGISPTRVQQIIHVFKILEEQDG